MEDIKNYYKRIALDTISKVTLFCSEANKLDSDINVRSKNYKYSVDGKSIMGIYSLDLSEDVLLEIQSRTEEIDAIERFLDFLNKNEIISGEWSYD